ncbi:hypothetical protein AB0L71_15505 [Streptomyces sp. NPDC052052]|uniref:hypothetical protein n=1 Tax=Streptomyces sp. NPDC052052 TaxID=3154756 RepID=UPI0034320AD6
MTSVRRTAKASAAALALLLAALAGCGTERSGGSGSGAPGSGRTAGASPYGDQGLPEGAAKYRENHAFQLPVELSAADRAKGDQEVKKIKAGLAGIAERRGITEPRLLKALTGLGYPREAVSTWTYGPPNKIVTFVVDIGAICVDGALDDTGSGLVTAEAHGRYLEGTGCVKPAGGH